VKIRLMGAPDGRAWIPGQQWAERKRAGRATERRTAETARRMLAGQRRALSVRRPWANLIFAGKTVENRTWSTEHRGEIIVHAGQAWAPAGAVLAAGLGITGFDDPRRCPGGYLGIVRLVDVHPAAGCCAPWGQPEPGTYHWVLVEPALFAEPVPGRGRLGLYWPPADLLEFRP
jgi:ASCH domain